MKCFLLIKNYSLSQILLCVISHWMRLHQESPLRCSAGKMVVCVWGAKFQLSGISGYGHDSIDKEFVLIPLLCLFLFHSCRSKQTLLRQSKTGGSKACSALIFKVSFCLLRSRSNSLNRTFSGRQVTGEVLYEEARRGSFSYSHYLKHLCFFFL